VPDAMVRLFDRYAGERREGERFYEWARRMPNDGLRTTIQRHALTPLPATRSAGTRPVEPGEGGRTSDGGVQATDSRELV
jgi:hypothetical protein